MQPYFFPYAGYFRLFTSADVFVVLDCVQLPRRGWVHRNRFANANGEMDWLTLPLEKSPQTTLIRDVRFRPGARIEFESAMRRFPVLEEARKTNNTIVERALAVTGCNVADYLHGLLLHVTELLGIQKPMLRSSALGIDPELRSQDRILALVKAVGGRRYVNSPGGRALYDHDTFTRSGVQLKFLAPYGGSMDSVLLRLLGESAAGIRGEIQRETVLHD